MKNITHPEFQILRRLELLREKYPDRTDLAELAEETRNTINENALSMMQSATLYALLGREGDLYPETRQKLLSMLESAADFCREPGRR